MELVVNLALEMAVVGDDRVWMKMAGVGWRGWGME